MWQDMATGATQFAELDVYDEEGKYDYYYDNDYDNDEKEEEVEIEEDEEEKEEEEEIEEEEEEEKEKEKDGEGSSNDSRAPESRSLRLPSFWSSALRVHPTPPHSSLLHFPLCLGYARIIFPVTV
ncbi:hypothetical protein M0802_002655 [Mischocyttarus mexicanus]|nr:hypothetical protein M0802_002655 [Mischocyttarus mexicanus]